VEKTIIGGAYYYEYRTDDARLTIEILKEAVNRGALALNYMKVNGFLYENNKITGVKAQDQFTGEAHQILAKKVVNATGPWVDVLDAIDDPAKGDKLYITKGVHIVVDYKKLPLRQAVYFDAPDRRMVFAIPRDGKTYIGTTDTFYKGDLANPQLSQEDLNYLLKAIHYMFPDVNIGMSDVESSWVGLRPLIRQIGKGPTEISRKDEIFQYDSGLITIAGGKLTGYRKMAERVVNLLSEQFKVEGKLFPPCTTHQIPVSGGYVNGSAGFDLFVKEKVKQGKTMGLPEKETTDLVRIYGSNIDKLFERIQRFSVNTSGFELPTMLLAQLNYSIEEEMVATPADFFIRRTGALYFNSNWVEQCMEPVIQYMADYFKWDALIINSFRQELQARLSEAKGKSLLLQSAI
jgi:glycerol-3-phosphate dehydrogenase